MLEGLKQRITDIKDFECFGTVIAINGLSVICRGISEHVSIGSRCIIYNMYDVEVIAEVTKIYNLDVTLIVFKEVIGIGHGCKVKVFQSFNVIKPNISWKGRIINALGEPLDKKGPLTTGTKEYKLVNAPPDAHSRNIIKDKMDTGIKCINAFLTCCYGQRMGIFAGSGVGKSVLISMFTRYANADVKVIGFTINSNSFGISIESITRGIPLFVLAPDIMPISL